VDPGAPAPAGEGVTGIRGISLEVSHYPQPVLHHQADAENRGC